MRGTNAAAVPEKGVTERTNSYDSGDSAGGKRQSDTDLNDTAQQRARREDFEPQSVKDFDPESPPPSEGGDRHSQTANAPPAEANERKRQKLYWIDIKPDFGADWTPAQKECAIHITVKDLAACALLPLHELNTLDSDYPISFLQTGSTTAEGELKVKGISVALPSHEARAQYVQHTAGRLLVSTRDDADDPDRQVLYSVKVHSALPEFAFALLRAESAHLIIYMRGAPFQVGQVEMRETILSQMRGVKIVHEPRRGTELDEHGRPLQGVIGTKPEMHARIIRTGGPFYLPRCLVVDSHPFRYSIKGGHFNVNGIIPCDRCHQEPCECETVTEDMKRSLQYKAQSRERKKNYSKQRSTSAEDGAPSDVRFDLLSTRGTKGKKAASEGTKRQAATACFHFFGATGVCPYGARCKFAHVGPCMYNRCKYTVDERENDIPPMRVANEPNRIVVALYTNTPIL